MGISANCVKFLNYAKSKGVHFDTTLTLGRQQIFFTDKERKLLPKQFINQRLPQSGDFGESVFQILGANEIMSIDHSDFEGATIVHNLNDPIPQQYFNRYSVVFDGGTLEHVFNFPVAIKSCMDMLKVGGHFIAITPTNNYSGHGFYQFSAELFFTLFTPMHGFNIKLVAITVENPARDLADWFEVKDPKSVGGRVLLTNSYPSSLMVIAEKIQETESIILQPFQSDYQRIWDIHQSVKTNTELIGEGRLINYYRKWIPKFFRDIIYRLRNGSGKVIHIKDLGAVNPLFFKKIDVEQ